MIQQTNKDSTSYHLKWKCKIDLVLNGKDILKYSISIHGYNRGYNHAWLQSCMVTTVHITCTQTTLHVHKSLCTILIPLCKNNLKLPMPSFFCPVFGYLLLLLTWAAMLAISLHWAHFFVCFYRSLLCSPAISQISLSQSEGWFSFILLCRQEKYRWTGPLGLCINYTNICDSAMCNSACRWFIGEKAKIFWSYVKQFWNLAGVRKCRILIGLCKSALLICMFSTDNKTKLLSASFSYF